MFFEHKRYVDGISILKKYFKENERMEIIEKELDKLKREKDYKNAEVFLNKLDDINGLMLHYLNINKVEELIKATMKKYPDKINLVYKNIAIYKEKEMK